MVGVGRYSYRRTRTVELVVSCLVQSVTLDTDWDREGLWN